MAVGRQVAVEHRRVFSDALERPHHVLLFGDAAIGQIDRNDRDAGNHRRESEVGQAPQRSQPDDDHHRKRNRGEYDEIAGGIRHHRHPERQPQRVSFPAGLDHPLGGKQRQGHGIRVVSLQVRKPGQSLGVECPRRSSQQ